MPSGVRDHRYGVVVAEEVWTDDWRDSNGNIILSSDGLGNIDGLAQIDADIQLGTDMELQDESGGALIAGDNSGNIDQLAQIDDEVATPLGSFERTLAPSAFVGFTQTGTINEYSGTWTTSAHIEIVLHLNRVVDYISLNSTVVVDSIQVFFNTNHNDVCISGAYVSGINSEDSGLITPFTDANNYADGTSGDDNHTYELDMTLVEDRNYIMRIACDGVAGIFIMRAIKIKYHLSGA